MATQYEEAALAKMSFGEISELRSRDDADHNQLAPYEHRAYMREEIEDNPARALVYGLVIPVYTAAKILASLSKDNPLIGATVRKTGLHLSRSTGSVKEQVQAYKGVGEGLMTAGRELFK